MDAPQSDFFKRMPAAVKRAAMRAAIAAQRPESGFETTFEFEGKTYRVAAAAAHGVNEVTQKAPPSRQ